MHKTIINSYNDDELKELVKRSTSYKDLARNMGYTYGASGDTIKKLKKLVARFDTSHFTTTTCRTNQPFDDKDIFCENSPVAQKTMRKHYIRGNYSEYKCSICGQLPLWNGKELTLILDHKNGKCNDHRLENLRWVCPNCNQQLPTTGSRNPNRTVHRKIWHSKIVVLKYLKEVPDVIVAPQNIEALHNTNMKKTLNIVSISPGSIAANVLDCLSRLRGFESHPGG